MTDSCSDSMHLFGDARLDGPRVCACGRERLIAWRYGYYYRWNISPVDYVPDQPLSARLAAVHAPISSFVTGSPIVSTQPAVPNPEVQLNLRQASDHLRPAVEAYRRRVLSESLAAFRRPVPRPSRWRRLVWRLRDLLP